jgi:hypothetical protein
MHQDMLEAAKNGQTLVPMKLDELLNSKSQVAIARGQYGLQQAMINAQARIQTANQKNSQMDDRFGDRIMSSADMASVSLGNIAHMRFGSNAGYMGTSLGATPGGSLMELAGGNLRAALSSDEQKMYNTIVTGLGTSLARVELNGGLQGGQALSQIIQQRLAITPQDTPISIMTKLAEARQILDNNTEIYTNSSTADPKKVAIIKQRLADMHNAVPFTVDDVIKFQQAQSGSNKPSYSDWAKQSGLAMKNYATEADVLGAAARGEIKDGDRINIDGKAGTWHHQ